MTSRNGIAARSRRIVSRYPPFFLGGGGVGSCGFSGSPRFRPKTRDQKPRFVLGSSTCGGTAIVPPILTVPLVPVGRVAPVAPIVPVVPAGGGVPAPVVPIAVGDSVTPAPGGGVGFSSAPSAPAMRPYTLGTRCKSQILVG